jgi:protein-S-isoprenylcysteine O-methyltransferase Ste14
LLTVTKVIDMKGERVAGSWALKDKIEWIRGMLAFIACVGLAVVVGYGIITAWRLHWVFGVIGVTIACIALVALLGDKDEKL